MTTTTSAGPRRFVEAGPATAPVTRVNGSPVPAERRALLATVARTLGEPDGRVLLVGEPGVGTTTLMAAALDEAEAGGALVLVAHGLRAGTGQPFHGLIDLFTLVPDEALDQLPEVQREALEVALARRHSARPLPPMALRVAVAALLARLAAAGPVVLALDDLPALDPETLEIVSYVLNRRHPAAHVVSLVATQRLESALSGRDDTLDTDLFYARQVLTVGVLHRSGLAEVLEAAVGRRLPAAEVTELHRRSGGNPMWAVEMRTQLGAGLASVVPMSVADLLRARIQALPPEVDELLTAVATMGTPRTGDLLRVVPAGASALVTAIGCGVLREAGGRVVPVHQLLAGAALEDRDPWRLMRLHRRVAEVVTDVGERAYHLDRSTPPGVEESVAAALHAASLEARSRGAVAAAVDSAERALARTDPDAAVAVRRRLTLAEMLFLHGSYEQTLAALAEIDVAHLEVGLLDRALPLLLSTQSVTADEETALQTLLDARAAASAARRSDPVRDAVYATYLAEAHLGGAAERRGHAEDAVRVLSAAGSAPVARHRALGAVILAELDAGEGLDHALLGESAALEDQLTLLALNDSADAQHGFYGYQVDDLDGSRKALLRMVEAAEGAGEDVMAGIFAIHLATTELLSGRTSAAQQWLARFDAVDPWAGRPPPVALRLRGLLALAQDDRAGLDTLLELPSGPGSVQQGELTRFALRGVDAARHEEWDAALVALTRGRDLAEHLGLRDPGRRHWLDSELAETQLALQDVAAARVTVSWVRHVADVGGRPVATGIALRLEGMVAAAEGDLEEAERLLTASVSALTAGPVPWQAARSLLELGRLLRRRRARARAGTALRGARSSAVQIDDLALLRRVEHELGAAAAPSGPGELTRSEWRIAASVTEGLNNAQLAATHFISVRTVETHLSAVYRKVGVHSRTELAAWVRAQAGSATEAPLRGGWSSP